MDGEPSSGMNGALKDPRPTGNECPGKAFTEDLSVKILTCAHTFVLMAFVLIHVLGAEPGLYVDIR